MEGRIQAIPNNPIFNILSFLMTMIIGVIILLPIQIYQFITGNFITIILLSGLGVWLTHFSFIFLLKIISSILFGVSLILNYDIIKESCVTRYYSFLSNMKFSPFIRKHRVNSERFNASQPIHLDNKRYAVIEYGTYKINLTNEGKLTGFIIFNYDDGTYVQDPTLRENLLKVYLMWRYIYFKATLGKDLKITKASKIMIKSKINFEKKLKLAIEKWSKNDYEKAKEKYDEEFIELIKELDKQALAQHPILVEKLNHQLWVMKNIYILFEKPSYVLYEEFYQKVNRIQELGAQENNIWNMRLSTWEKLYSYKDLKIRKMPEPNLKWLFRGILGDLINYFFLQSKFPIGGATISGFSIEVGKKLNKEVRKFINRVFTYHMVGIDAIRKNIEINQRFKELRDNYRQIWNNPPVSKIRH